MPARLRSGLLRLLLLGLPAVAACAADDLDLTLVSGVAAGMPPADDHPAPAPAPVPPPPPPPAPGPPAKVIRPGWDFEPIGGVRFGGIVGAGVDPTLTYVLRGSVDPQLSGTVGISGVAIALGARWTNRQHAWVIDQEGMHLVVDTETALAPRLIAAYRWDDRRRSPAFWRGIAPVGGWYWGGELDVLLGGLAFAVQATWRQHDHEQTPRVDLAYGLDF